MSAELLRIHARLCPRKETALTSFWNLPRQCPYLVVGPQRAGFFGGRLGAENLEGRIEGAITFSAQIGGGIPRK